MSYKIPLNIALQTIKPGYTNSYFYCCTYTIVLFALFYDCFTSFSFFTQRAKPNSLFVCANPANITDTVFVVTCCSGKISTTLATGTLYTAI